MGNVGQFFVERGGLLGVVVVVTHTNPLTKTPPPPTKKIECAGKKKKLYKTPLILVATPTFLPLLKRPQTILFSPSLFLTIRLANPSLYQRHYFFPLTSSNSFPKAKALPSPSLYNLPFRS